MGQRKERDGLMFLVSHDTPLPPCMGGNLDVMPNKNYFYINNIYRCPNDRCFCLVCRSPDAPTVGGGISHRGWPNATLMTRM